MGNRAVITTPEHKIGLYPHCNGGRDTVESLLRYCERLGDFLDSVEITSSELASNDMV